MSNGNKLGSYFIKHCNMQLLLAKEKNDKMLPLGFGLNVHSRAQPCKSLKSAVEKK